MKRFIKVLSGAIDRIITSIFVLMMFFGIYALYDSYSLYLSAQDRGLLAYKPQPDTVYEEVPFEGYVAWLTLDDTTIDYPIMQGIDNDEFLNKDPHGNYSLAGSIFLDYRNAADFSDDYSLVYGHHMGHGAMFGALDNYKQWTFFRDHKEGTLMVGGKTQDLYVFAVVETTADEELIFSPDSSVKSELITYIEDTATYYDDQADVNEDRIVALSTCSSDGSMERLVVFATIEP